MCCSSFLQDVDEYKRELKSRQRKIDNNLDNWGQKLPNNDPFGVGRQMALDQKKLNKTLKAQENRVSSPVHWSFKGRLTTILF